jgi:hypothetical protein
LASRTIAYNIEFFSISNDAMTKKLSNHDEPVGFSVAGILALAGGRGAVAKALGLSVQSVAKWGRRIPAQHARRVAVLAGLPLELVRPDMVQRGHSEAVDYVAKDDARL